MNTSFLRILFRLHDSLTDEIIRHMRIYKVCILVLAYVSLLGLAFPLERRSFGSLALEILLIIMFLSPLSRLFRMRLLLILMGFRRELGILMGFLATVHTLGYFFDPAFMMRMILSHSSAWWGMDWRILSGLLAYALTLPLLLTSNSWSQRLLAQNWKRLHRLAYPLLLFVLIHKFVFAGTLTVANVGGVLGGLVVFGVYCGVRFLANHPEKFPLMQTLILWVSRQYQSYRTTL